MLIAKKPQTAGPMLIPMLIAGLIRVIERFRLSLVLYHGIEAILAGLNISAVSETKNDNRINCQYSVAKNIVINTNPLTTKAKS